MDIYIICSKRWGSRVDKKKSSPAFLDSTIEHNLSTVDLMIRAMGFPLHNIYLIGGYHIEKLVDRFSGLKFLYEEKWKSKNWTFCKDIILKSNQKEIIFISSEIIFNKNIVKKLKVKLKNKKSFICSVDYKNIDQLEKKQFSYSSRGRLQNFAGIIYLSSEHKGNVQKISDYLDIINFSKLHILSNISKINISNIEILHLNNCWETIFKDKALAKSFLGTKAETLQRLKPLVKKSFILPCLLFSVSDWKSNKRKILDDIVNFTDYEHIILRSSSGIEDSWSESHAGSFESILNVIKDNKIEVIQAVEEVIKGYKKSRDFNEKWQILVQPQQIDVKLSGVAFTSSVSTGAPYIEIYYDDTTSSTDTITSGTGKGTKSSILFKPFAAKLSNGWKKNLIHAFLEIERILSYDKLDIEFCIPKNGLPIIFQVRPITGIVEQTDKINELENRIIDQHSFYKKLSINDTQANFLILSNTADWNPAEMIGENITFFEKSLYETLITNDTWSESRKRLGYNFDHNSFGLMVVMGNNPLINVNKSFNSFIPKNINNKVKEKILKSALDYLSKNRHKHREIEFDVIPNCYFPNFENHWGHIFTENLFTKSEFELISKSYRNQTLNIIANTDTFQNNFNTSIDNLNLNFTKFQTLKNKTDFLEALLHNTKFEGVLPFATAARLGFISLQWIKSIEKNCDDGKNLVTEFLSNIPNIATNITNRLEEAKFDIKCQKLFLMDYGFLRPNSYDLLSDDYFLLAEQGMLFEKKFKTNQKQINNIPHIDLSFIRHRQIFKTIEIPIKLLLEKFKIQISEKVLIKFLVLGIYSREYMKFAFMRHVWGIIETIKIFSIEKKIHLKEAKFIRIEEFLDFSKNVFGEAEFEGLMAQVRLRQKRFEQNKKIKLPEVIIKQNDIYSFYDVSIKGFFISSHKIKGKIIDYNKIKSQDDLKGRIIIIESADPGFDWIFSKGILGFITCHGGLGSHMAIRATEFDMPALIGCGAKFFQKFIHNKFIELDCENKSIGFF